MNVFDLRDRLVNDYASHTQSFTKIVDSRISRTVDSAMKEGMFWREPLLQPNPTIERMHMPNPTPDNRVETTFQADGAGMLMTLPDERRAR